MRSVAGDPWTCAGRGHSSPDLARDGGRAWCRIHDIRGAEVLVTADGQAPAATRRAG